MTRSFHVPPFLSALLLVPLPLPTQAADWSSPLAALPPVPPPARTDWLVRTPARRAGVFRGAGRAELVLDNGLLRRTFVLAPAAATIALDQLSTGESFLRAVRPECEVSLDGTRYAVGGLRGQLIGNYLLPSWIPELKADPAAFRCRSFESGPIRARCAWRRRREWLSSDPPWPPPGVHLILHFGPPLAPRAGAALAGVTIDVHYELYDGLPLFSKWFTLHNGGERPLRLDTFTSEILAATEAASEVEAFARRRLPNLHVETDFTTVSMSGEGSQRQTVHWLPDPSYTTQVNYQLETPCLLECRPPLGPARDVAPGETFSSFRTWILAHDSTERWRQTLALCRMYRTIAPWVAENPLIFHVRSAAPDAVRHAIDQAAAVGFELVIMTFGSGFNLENDSPAHRRQIRELADYAHARGVGLGGYSLLASRSVGPEHDVVNPATGKPGGFATFGNSPCLGSAWGREYFQKLYRFFEETGCDVLEHDGSYPGDACAATSHPGHRGYEDSRWRQWETITAFYRWCRGRGIYLNVPDWYFLSGSSKTGMGYRETNWSLPRAQQELIERQNIHDGTRFKTPTMGWMFVPLTEYHGGGAAATIEPLAEHLEHYERRLANLLGAGVQACFRGPRLYDTPRTQAAVKRWVDFYKRHRAILDADIVPLRRADGRDWDGLLHVNPSLATPALGMVYNPREEALQRTIRLPLATTGLDDTAWLRVGDGPRRRVALDRRREVQVRVTIPARGSTWILVEAPGKDGGSPSARPEAHH